MLRIALSLAMAAVAPAAELPLCLQSAERLDGMTVATFERELGAILTRSGHAARFNACADPAAVRLLVSGQGLAAEPDALGAAPRLRGAGIGQDLRIFVQPIARLIGTRLPSLLGPAMARVAAHEIGHYLSQSGRHGAARGIMAESLSAPELLASRARH